MVVVAIQLLPLPDIHALDGLGVLKARPNRSASAAPCAPAPCPDRSDAASIDPGTLLLAGAALTVLGTWMRRYLAGRPEARDSASPADLPNAS